MKEPTFSAMMSKDITEIKVSIARIEENMKSDILKTIDHEARLKELEKWRWKSVGVASLSASAVGAAVTYFIK